MYMEMGYYNKRQSEHWENNSRMLSYRWIANYNFPVLAEELLWNSFQMQLFSLLVSLFSKY